MRNLIASAAAIALLGAAGSAFAQSALDGTVTINGSVASKCTATGGFTDTQDLSELADADGLLSTTHSGTTAGAPAFTSNFTVRCTGANAGVSVTSTALTTATTAPTGYTNTVNFTGRGAFDLVHATNGASTLNVDDDSSVAAATTDSFGAANFLANTTNNVRVSAYALNTAASALLVAGSYTGSIVVTITPS